MVGLWKNHLLICVILIAVVISPQPIQADENQKISVCIFQMEPLNFIDHEGTAKGLYPDLLREIVKDEKWGLTFFPGSWSECYERVSTGTVDLITTIGYSEQRAKIFEYNHQPVADIWGRLYRNPAVNVTGMSDLNNKKVGVVKKDINGKNFIKTVNKLNVAPLIIEFNTHHDVFEAVQKGTIDAGVVPQHFGFRFAKDFGLVPTTIEFEPFSVYIASRKGKNIETLNHIDGHLQSWKNDPESFYFKKVSYWMGGQYGMKDPLPKWVKPGLVTISLCVFALFVHNFRLKTIVRDRTRKINEDKKRFRTLAESTNAIPWEFDLTNNRFAYLSPRISDVFGYSQADWSDLNSWAEKIHPDDREQAVGYCQIQTEKGLDHEMDYRIICEDGSIRWIHEIVVISEQKNDQKKLVGYFIDTTELEEKRAHLIRSSQLASLGELSAGVAHEINNPINGVINYADVLKLRVKDPAVNEMLDRIIFEGERIATIVRQLLTFARDDGTEFKLEYVDTLIKASFSLIGEQLRKDSITIDFSIEDDSATIYCNAQQVEQVFLNLLSNSRYALNEKYSNEGNKKKIEISTKNIKKDSINYVSFTFRDNGTGIKQDDLSKILNAFYTTKELGVGTGLGLSICEDIIKKHKGTINIDSCYGEYTAVTITLPVATNGVSS